MAYDMQTIKQKFKDGGIYHTPEALALKLKKYIPDDITEVYDPTCGTGNLLKVYDDQVKKYGQEIDQAQVEIIKNENILVNAEIVQGDTLGNPAFKDKKFRAIVANPPFGIKWNPPKDKNTDERFRKAPTIPTAGNADFAFWLHILHYLADDGVAVVLQFPGTLYRGNREKELRQWFVDNNYIDTIEFVPGDTFVDTKIETVCVVFKKNKTSTDIKLIKEDKEIIITKEQVVENNYGLSWSNFYQEEDKREKINPVQLELDARNSVKRYLKSALEISEFVEKLWEDDNVKLTVIQFINDLEKIIKEYKKDYLARRTSVANLFKGVINTDKAVKEYDKAYKENQMALFDLVDKGGVRR